MSDKTRDRILNLTVPSETVEFQGIQVEVRGMTIAQQQKFLVALSNKDGDVDRERFTAELLIATVYEGDSPVFEPADRDRIQGLPAHVLRPLIEAANRVAGFGVSVEEAGKG